MEHVTSLLHMHAATHVQPPTCPHTQHIHTQLHVASHTQFLLDSSPVSQVLRTDVITFVGFPQPTEDHLCPQVILGSFCIIPQSLGYADFESRYLGN